MVLERLNAEISYDDNRRVDCCWNLRLLLQKSVFGSGYKLSFSVLQPNDILRNTFGNFPAQVWLHGYNLPLLIS